MTLIEQIRQWEVDRTSVIFTIRRGKNLIILLPDDTKNKSDAELHSFIEDKFTQAT